MKRITFLIVALLTHWSLTAQWVNDPLSNTFVANCPTNASEVLLSANPASSELYVQWLSSQENGWSPSLQYITANGIPRWGNNGLHLSGHNFNSLTEGTALASTDDNAVVSCFTTAAGQCVAVKINNECNFVWGEQGITLFDGQGGGQTELMATSGGALWALGADDSNTYLQYVNADGSLNPLITISDPQKACHYGLMVPAPNNGVFVVYEKEVPSTGDYSEKEIYVEGYLPDGTQTTSSVQLMSAHTMVASHHHYVVPDGEYGAYVYLWYPDANEIFNTYVFHFDQTGASTISDTNGIAVRPISSETHVLNACGTVDPDSRHLIITYLMTDVATQTRNAIGASRITSTGEHFWNNGVIVEDLGLAVGTALRADAHEDGSAVTITFLKSTDGLTATVEALCISMIGRVAWSTTLSSTATSKVASEGNMGFLHQQNVCAWIDATNGGLYAQNFSVFGEMGDITPVQVCDGPENLTGLYVHNDQTNSFGVKLLWDDPMIPILSYNIYRTDLDSGEEALFIMDGNNNAYFDACPIGHYKYQLKALYADCGTSLPATTAEGDDYVIMEVTSVNEDADDDIVIPTRIYTLSGQLIQDANLETLSRGVYIIQGLSRDGRLVTQKIVVN